jgi:hypothetical protein
MTRNFAHPLPLAENRWGMGIFTARHAAELS